MKTELKVIVHHDEPISKKRMKSYVRDAVVQWSKGGHPEDALWSIKRVTFKAAPKPNTDSFSPIAQKIWELRNLILKYSPMTKVTSIGMTRAALFELTMQITAIERRTLGEMEQGRMKTIFGINLNEEA